MTPASKRRGTVTVAARSAAAAGWSSQLSIVGPVTSCSLFVLVVSLLLLLPGTMRSEESEILLGDEEMQNDDLIVSRTGAECPPDDEDECTFETDTKNMDNLIFPKTSTSTRKPRPAPRTTPTPVRQSTTPEVIHPRPSSCGTGNSEDDDEDCTDTSSGAESPDATISGPPSDTGDSGRQTASSTVDGPRSPMPPLPTPTSFQTPSAAAHTQPPSENDWTERSGPGTVGRLTDPDDGNHYHRGSQQPSTSIKDQPHQQIQGPSGGGGFWQNFPTTFNVNIFLIIGIAAGFIVLVITLIVAVCKYAGTGNGRSVSTANGGSRHNRRNGKGNSTAGGNVGMGAGGAKCGYAYEACNTMPPGHDPSSAGGMHHPYAQNVPLVVNATSNVHPGLYGGVASPALQTGYASMTSPSPYPSAVVLQQQQQLAGPTAPHTPMAGPGGGCSEVAKPLAKKDVKEWYV